MEQRGGPGGGRGEEHWGPGAHVMLVYFLTMMYISKAREDYRARVCVSSLSPRSSRRVLGARDVAADLAVGAPLREARALARGLTGGEEQLV